MPSDHLSTTFAALADPTRRAILARLASGETTVSELAAPFEMSLPAVTKHLKVLQRAGLITQSRQAQWRPCRIEPAPLRDVTGWLEQYRQLWEQRLDRLEDYLRELQANEQQASEQQQLDQSRAATTKPARGRKSKAAASATPQTPVKKGRK